MGLLKYFRESKPSTAKLAKERLQVVIAHQRGERNSRYEFLPAMQREILEVIRKYIPIDQEQVHVNLEQEGDYEVLELNVTLPDKP
ncbi:cell division topological specificity factor MinE [Thiohalomonas denitrificans]|uniref:Cell division topological specificity factor n=1 Tax=Thiohalomonas denitrificans TaxID=415747 RepID=A0A1G5PZ49_9GAMM|nr:cell division topological specificity factor MinE [Thiohalomonas denitrificans]SCZ54823.1 cell division topological specificity factor [Thiohalomonas denitrificans]